jgi:perosamine synthetase
MFFSKLFVSLKPIDGHSLSKVEADLAENLWFIGDSIAGKPIKSYQEALAKWQVVSIALAFGSGRAALWAILRAFELPSNSKVFVSGYTCIAVPQAVKLAGLNPIFVDIESDSYGLDLDDFKQKLIAHPDAKVLVVQHLYGLVSRDYEALVATARAAGLRVVEDISQSTGAKYKGRRIGSLGDAAFTSSEQSKIWCTMRGGVAFTNDTYLGAKIKSLRSFLPRPDEKQTRLLIQSLRAYIMVQRKQPYVFYKCLLWRYKNILQHKESNSYQMYDGPDDEKLIPVGLDFSSIARPMAIIGKSQIEKLDELAEKRRNSYHHMSQLLSSLGATASTPIADSEPVWLRIPFTAPNIERVVSKLRQQGYQTGTWFETPIHGSEIIPKDCPNALRLAGQVGNVGSW